MFNKNIISSFNSQFISVYFLITSEISTEFQLSQNIKLVFTAIPTHNILNYSHSSRNRILSIRRSRRYRRIRLIGTNNLSAQSNLNLEIIVRLPQSPKEKNQTTPTKPSLLVIFHIMITIIHRYHISMPYIEKQNLFFQVQTILIEEIRSLEYLNPWKEHLGCKAVYIIYERSIELNYKFVEDFPIICELYFTEVNAGRIIKLCRIKVS